LRQFRLRFHISGFELCFQPRHLLHVAFGKFLESHFIILGHGELFVLLLELVGEMGDAPLELVVFLLYALLLLG